jgi:predicted HTH domain antitoxin
MAVDQVTTVRLRRDTLALLDRMAAKLAIERSTLIRRAVDRGARSVLLDEAIPQYLRGEVSAGAAAEWAGVSLLELMDELRVRGLPYLVDNEGIGIELKEVRTKGKSRGRLRH